MPISTRNEAIAGARTLQIHRSAIPVVSGHPALEPVRLQDREGVNCLFEYEQRFKTSDALNRGASVGAGDKLPGEASAELLKYFPLYEETP